MRFLLYFGWIIKFSSVGGHEIENDELFGNCVSKVGNPLTSRMTTSDVAQFGRSEYYILVTKRGSDIRVVNKPSISLDSPVHLVDFYTAKMRKLFVPFVPFLFALVVGAKRDGVIHFVRHTWGSTRTSICAGHVVVRVGVGRGTSGLEPRELR